MFEQDYIMRQIHEIIRAILRVLLGRDADEPDGMLLENDQQREMLCRLTALVDEGRVDEAENLLYESFALCGVKAALLFYRHLNEKDDAFLAAHDFSREEIESGIRDAMRRAGLAHVMDALS